MRTEKKPLPNPLIRVIILYFNNPTSGYGLAEGTEHPALSLHEEPGSPHTELKKGTAILFHYSPHKNSEVNIGQEWFLEKVAENTYHLVGPAAPDLLPQLVVSPDGSIRVLGMKETVSAMMPDPRTVIVGMTPIYHKFIPSPPGTYTFAWLNADERTVFCLSLVKPILNPSEMKLQSSPINLTGLKFHFPHGVNLVGSLPLTFPSSPEYPNNARSTVAYSIPELKQEMPFQACFSTDVSHLSMSVIGVRAINFKDDEFDTIVHQQFTFAIDISHEFLFSSYFTTDKIKNLYVGFIPIKFNADQIFNGKKEVGIFSVSWLWQSSIRGENGFQDWQNIVEVPLSFCLTLDAPNTPWNTDNNPHPLEGLVRRACTWCEGATNEFEVALNLTKSLNDSSWFLYNGSVASMGGYYEGGERKRPDKMSHKGIMEFNSCKLNEILLGLYGKFVLSDCTDMAYSLMVIANAMGCNLKVLTLTPTGKNLAIVTREVLTLGALASSKNNNFSYHQISVIVNPVTTTQFVFDPCLRIVSHSGSKEQVLGMELSAYLAAVFKSPDKIHCEFSDVPVHLC